MMTHEELDHTTKSSRHSRKVGLQIFLSYASERQAAAEEIALALKERGHRVFFDRDQLSPGGGFHARIEQEVQQCDLAVFLISPESIATGSYTLTELGYVSQRFEHPAGHVLPVLVAPTPLNAIPNYLRAVTMLQPKGNVAAEVAAAVDRLCPPKSRRMLTISRTEHDPEAHAPTVTSGHPSKARKILTWAQRPYWGAIGLTLIVVANILNYAGNEGTILDVIYDSVGINALKKLDLFIRPSTIVLLTLGYLLTFLWLTRWARSNLALLKSLSIATILIAVFSANITLGLPHEPELQEILDHKFRNQLSSWTERILSHQDSLTGGIRGAPDYRSPPNIWSTAQVLVGVLSAAEANPDLRRHAAQIKSALHYLRSTEAAKPQVGWGYYDKPEHTITEVSSWGTMAYLMSLESAMRDALWFREQIPDVIAETEQNLQAIAARQHRSGGWIPIEGSSDEADTRTYSTVMALWVLLEAAESPVLPSHIRSRYATQIKNGVTWLLQNYDDHFGWVPNPNRERQTEVFIGLSAQIIYILGRAEDQNPQVEEHPNYRTAQRWILARHANYNDLVAKNLQGNRRTHDADVHLVGLRFTLEQSTFLWFPWSYANLSMLVTDPGWSIDERRAARDARLKMSLRFEELDAYLEQEFPYVLAENLFAISSGLRWADPAYRSSRDWRASGAALRTHEETMLSQLLRGTHPGAAQTRRERAG